MEISIIRSYNRIFAILSGLAVGIVFILIFHLAGVIPIKYITLLYNTNFLTQQILTSTIISIILFSISIISAGVVTTFLLYKRNCILGGITGIFIILLTLMVVYSFGIMQFPIFPQIHAILGFTGIPLVFLIYAIPTAMIGFILGYLGSYLAKNSHTFK